MYEKDLIIEYVTYNIQKLTLIWQYDCKAEIRRYIIHSITNTKLVIFLDLDGPPNSAFMFLLNLRYMSMVIQTKASIQNINTEKPRAPASTWKSSPFILW